MQPLADLLKVKTPESPPKYNFTNSRQVIIQDIVDRINKEREGTKFKKVTWKQINGIVAHVKGFELGWLYQEACKRSNFSKYFFGVLKK